MNLDSAAIVCEHVASGAPILFARRDESVEDEDSGWQFSCNSVPKENPNNAKVWLLREILAQEPSLSNYLMLPSGAELSRSSSSSLWTVK